VDIRFIAVIFLFLALMDLIAKALKKARDAGLEEVEAPRRPADPLAGVLEEMQRLPQGDESGPEVWREAGDYGIGDGRTREREVIPRVPESRGEPVVSARSGPVLGRPGADSAVPLPPPGRVDEPVTLRGQIERMFEPMTPPPAKPVVVPDPPPRAAPVVPYRDRSARPVEVRSREARPREARDLAERAWTGERAVAAPKPAGDRERQRAEARRGGGGGVLDLGSVRGLRRLVVAREVLGPPLALRDSDRFADR
jgi:hypothetical protein